MRRSLAMRLALTIWLVYLFHFNPLAPGSDRFVCLTRAIAERGSITVDAYRDQTTELSARGGHTYINTNPGVSFLAAPAWAIAHRIYRQIPETSPARHEAIAFFLAHFIAFTTTTAPLAALTGLLLARFVYARTGRTWRALLAGLLYAFGTIAFFFATRLQQNIVIAFLSLLIFVLVFAPEAVSVRRRSAQLAGIGLCAGGALLVDLSILPLLAAMSIPVLAQVRSLRGVSLLVGGMAGPVAALMLYQQAAFGNPFLPAQAYIIGSSNVHSGGALGVTLPDPGRILDHLVTPKAGLLLYMPFTLLALWYLWRFRGESRRLSRSEMSAIVSGLLLYLLYIGAVPSSQFSDFGPRYLLPVVPLLCLPFALYLGRKELQLAAVLAGISVAVNIAGAQRGIATENLAFVLALFGLSGPWLPVLDWARAALPNVAGYTPAVVSPYGLLLFLSVCLAAIWLPEAARAVRRKQVRGDEGAFNGDGAAPVGRPATLAR